MNDVAPPRPLSVADWLIHLDDPVWPVQTSTALRLEELRAQEDALGNVSAHLLAEDLGSDPLLSLKVLVAVSAQCVPRGAAPPETLLGAVLMLGIGPFFRLLTPQATLEASLGDRPRVLQALSDVLQRSRQAAHWAHQFACHRQDADAEIIHAAGLLHDFVELLLWWKSPETAWALQGDRPGLPLNQSEVARQQAVMGCTLQELSMALMRHWHLPELLVRCCDDGQGDIPQVQTVRLAVRMAHHVAHGDVNPLLPAEERVGATDEALNADVLAIAQLLTLSEAAVRHKLDLPPAVPSGSPAGSRATD